MTFISRRLRDDSDKEEALRVLPSELSRKERQNHWCSSLEADPNENIMTMFGAPIPLDMCKLAP